MGNVDVDSKRVFLRSSSGYVGFGARDLSDWLGKMRKGSFERFNFEVESSAPMNIPDRDPTLARDVLDHYDNLQNAMQRFNCGPGSELHLGTNDAFLFRLVLANIPLSAAVEHGCNLCETTHIGAPKKIVLPGRGVFSYNRVEYRCRGSGEHSIFRTGIINGYSQE